jgi:uncharacterized Ntn-hydrolase superfamily protein
MTFSIAARCPRTGAFGVSITTASICVGARCPFVQAKHGAVLSQNRTDPVLGLRGIELLKAGRNAQQVVDELVRGGRHIGWRQLAVVDKTGAVAHFSGDKIVSLHGGHEGPQCVSIGNLLKDARLPKAMVDGFMERPEAHIADRLIRALEAGLEAGGETNPVRSATLLVAESHEFPEINLRVDWHDDPVAELGRIWRAYEPQMANYMLRVADPGAAI